MAGIRWPGWARAVFGAGGNVVGQGWAAPGQPRVGSKPRHKARDPHLKYPGMHGDVSFGAPVVAHQSFLTPNRPAWWSWGALGSHGGLVGQQISAGVPAVGSKPRHKPRDPHLRYPGGHPTPSGHPGMHGDSTHPRHSEDMGDSGTPGATDSNSPNYGSGSFDVDTDPMVSDIDLTIGMTHGIGTPGSFDATLAGGGLGPHAMSVLPGQHGLPYDGYADPKEALDDYADDPSGAYQPYADDPYSPPLREPNRRNYLATFGLDAEMGYSGFGPAAIIGCDVDDTGMRG